MEIILILWIFLSKSAFINYDVSLKIITSIIGIFVALSIPIKFVINIIRTNNYKFDISFYKNKGKLFYVFFSIFLIFSLINNIRVNDVSELEKPLSFLAMLLVICYGLLASSVLNKRLFITRFNQISYISLVINLIFLLFLHQSSWEMGRFQGYLSQGNLSALCIIVSCFLTPKLFQTDNLRSIRIDTFFIILNLLFAYLTGSRSCVFIILIITAITLFSKVGEFKFKFKTNNKSIFKKFSIFAYPIFGILGYYISSGVLNYGPRIKTQNAFDDRLTQWSYAFIDPKLTEGIGLSAKFVLDSAGDTKYTHFLDPHNLYLTTLLNLGILTGLIMFIFMIFTLIYVLRKLKYMNYDYCFYLLIFSIILISPIGGSMFSLNNFYDRVAWISLSFIFL